MKITDEQIEALDFEQCLPISIEAEQALIGAVLREPDWMLKAGFVKPHHFSQIPHQQIWQVMKDGYHRHGTFSAISVGDTLVEELRSLGGKQYLGKLMSEAAVVYNAAHYANLVLNMARRRELQEIFRQAETTVTHLPEGKDLDEALAEIQGEIQRVGESGNALKFETSKEIATRLYDSLGKKLSCFSTGIKRLDACMAGGIYQGKSYGVTARKKTGKTVLAATISYNMNKAGVKHLFLTAEMSPDEIMQRSISRAMGCSSMDFLNSTRETQGFKNKVAEYAVKGDSGNTIFLHKPGLTLESLRTAIITARVKFGITGFILDYWQLVGGKKSRVSMAEHLDEVAQWIADYCRKEGLWSFTMGQTNQDGNTRGGEGMRLAFDQVYHLQGLEGRVGCFWMEMMDTRYTPWENVGADGVPGLYMNVNGPFFEGVER